MLFEYSPNLHIRKHGPRGYVTYQSYKPWLRDEFVFRCAYCLSREVWWPNQQGSFSTDHFIPQVIAPDQILNYDNLVYACTRCNSWKQDYIVLDPGQVAMNQHIRVKDDGTIEALTLEGIEHVQILRLDDPVLTEFRKRMIDTLRRLQALPDEESRELIGRWFGFPKDLPNLLVLRPPQGNSRPQGVINCFYKQRELGQLPEIC